MAHAATADRTRGVVVIDSHTPRRALLEHACRAAGVKVRAVTAIAELERWPIGEIVVTEMTHLTPWWRHLGAVEVIAIVDNEVMAAAALEGGATRCAVGGSPAALATVITVLCRRHLAPSLRGEFRARAEETPT